MNWLVKRAVKRQDILLEVGCADGQRAKIYTTFTPNTIGIDLSKISLSRGTRQQGLDYVLCDWDHLPFRDKAIDVITFDNGLEHSSDPITTLKEIARACRREAIFGVPHEPDYAVGQGVHLHEFTHQDFEGLISQQFYILESYLLRHGYGGYNYIYVRGVKHESLSYTSPESYS